jgi:heme-degrading monooxygenase HmoA
MTIIKINAITVPGDNGDELARRFAARAGAVDDLLIRELPPTLSRGAMKIW